MITSALVEARIKNGEEEGEGVYMPCHLDGGDGLAVISLSLRLHIYLLKWVLVLSSYIS